MPHNTKNLTFHCYVDGSEMAIMARQEEQTFRIIFRKKEHYYYYNNIKIVNNV